MMLHQQIVEARELHEELLNQWQRESYECEHNDGSLRACLYYYNDENIIEPCCIDNCPLMQEGGDVDDRE